MAGVEKIINKNTSSTKALATVDNEEVTYEEFEAYLNANGMFVYSLEKTPVITPCSSGSTDVKMNTAMVIYSSSANEWSVTGGGYWINSAYEKDIPGDAFLYVGKITNIGGQDAVGVTMYQTSGTKPTLKRCSGYVHDGNGSNITLNNPYNLDSSRGIAFEFQDYKKVTKVNFATHNYTYMGYGFSAQAIYDSKFTYYDGKARTYYAHTWETTDITSIGISADGFSTSWSSSDYRWAVYNNSETIF